MKKVKTFQKLRGQERQQRRDIILDAAERVFATTPFTEVSMRRIANELGISATSIYTYFPDQESLFIESYMRRTKNLLDLLKKIVEESDGNMLSKLATAYIEYLVKQEAYFKMVVHFMLYARLNSDSLSKLNTIERAVLDCLEAAFIKNKAAGNTRYLAHTFFAALNGILVTFYSYPGRTEKEVFLHMKRLTGIICGLIDPASMRQMPAR